MSYTIAIAGKGGTGKTTVASLLIRALKESSSGSILAVDADPNSNLAESLGVRAERSIGSILDGVAKNPESVPTGMTKERFIDYQVQTAITESEGFDILVMGKPEGPGCYCYVNNILRGLMSRLIKDYDYIIIDNEAGLEHLSRRTTRQADLLIIISDPTKVGFKAAERINALSQELELEIGRKSMIVNRVSGGLKNEHALPGVEFAGVLPFDEEIMSISANGGSFFELGPQSKSLKAFREIKTKLLKQGM